MSSRKNVILPFQLIVNGDMSDDIVSTPTVIQYMDNVAIQLNFTGTPTGSFAVEVSLDYVPGTGGTVLNAGNWIALNIDPEPAAAGSASSIMLDLYALSASYIRVSYTASSGSGTLNCFISAKEL